MADNNAFQALVTDYFTGSGYNSEESDDDDIGIPLICVNALHRILGECMALWGEPRL